MRAGLLCCMWLGGCSADAVPLHCPGQRPAIEDCFTGRSFAECGGDGGPLFACTEIGFNDCRWFVDGCVAAGYEASSCPVDDLCCHDSFPFPDTMVDDVDRLGIYWHLYADGLEPWNRTDHMVVDVAVDPDLTAMPTSLQCAGFSYGAPPCQDNSAHADAGDIPALTFGGLNLYGELVIVEIDPLAPGGPIGRACLAPFTDVGSYTCPAPFERDCAETGQLTVNGLDNNPPAAGTVDLTFPSGKHFWGTFTVE